MRLNTIGRLSLVLSLIAALPGGAYGKILKLDTPSTSLVLDAEKGKALKFLYYGGLISDNDASNLRAAGSPVADAYPAYGLDATREAALSAVHADGNMTLDLKVDSYESRKENGAEITSVKLKDAYYPFDVTVCYRTYPDEDVIESWTEISHQEKGEVTLDRFASACLPIRYGNVWLSQLYGSWGNEGRVDCSPLTHGMRVIKNRDGVRNSHTAHAELMLSLDGKPRENDGRVIGAALCYSGNYKLVIDIRNITSKKVRFSPLLHWLSLTAMKE